MMIVVGVEAARIIRLLGLVFGDLQRIFLYIFFDLAFCGPNFVYELIKLLSVYRYIFWTEPHP
ncbi:hypothetical protein [Methylobacter sp.]|uniref:hypothetical protein n=1 Tax=Methylobacter sp. TaxID=2051955 RepID=UPI002FDDD456